MLDGQESRIITNVSSVYSDSETSEIGQATTCFLAGFLIRYVLNLNRHKDEERDLIKKYYLPKKERLDEPKCYRLY